MFFREPPVKILLFLLYHQLAHIAGLDGDNLDNFFLFGGLDDHIHRRQFRGFAVAGTDGCRQQDGVIRSTASSPMGLE